MATSPFLNATRSLSGTRALTVEVANQPIKARVVREGFQVPPIQLDNQAATFFFDNLPVLPPRQAPRVVTQSIKPGTKVTAGTVVDLVLAPSRIIPFDIFEGVHADLKGRNLTTLLDGMLQDPVARQSLLKYDTVEELPQAERAALTASFASANVGVDDAVPERSFESAFNSARAALAFK